MVVFLRANEVTTHFNLQMCLGNSGFLTSPILSPQRPAIVSKSDSRRILWAVPVKALGFDLVW